MSLESSNFRYLPVTQNGGLPSLGLVIGCLGCIFGSALPAGHNLGVINAPQQVVRNWTSEVLAEEYGLMLTAEQEYFVWGVVVSVMIAGAAFASALGATTAQHLGRCGGLVVAHTMSFVSGLLIMSCHYAQYVELLIVGRLLAGLAAGLSTSLVPLYLSEVAPRSMRGVMGVIFPFGLCLAILISQILGSDQLLGNASKWPFLVGGHSVYALVGLLMFPCMPKSPTYLLMVKNDPLAAHKELLSLRKGDLVAVEEEERILASAALNKSVHGKRYAPFWARSIVCVVLLNAGQQLVGINAVFFYSTLVFLNAGLSTTASIAAAISAGLANIIMAGAALPLIRYCRRKRLLLISLFLYTICLTLLVIGLHLVEEVAWAPWLAFGSLFCAVLTYGLGMGPVPYMIGTEMFSADDRDLGLSVGASSNWAGNFVVGLCFPIVVQYIGHFSFCIFIVLSALLWVFVYCCVPETYGWGEQGAWSGLQPTASEDDSGVLYTSSVASNAEPSQQEF